MFSPSAFVERDLRWLDRLAEHDPFATLITTDASGLPQATPLPVLYQRRDDHVLIEGHWAAANPQAGHRGPALMLFHGPHAYVSPGWYPDKLTAARVPTWNYATAQLRGELETFTDTDALGDLVDRLSAVHEARVGHNWQRDRHEARQVRMLSAIVGFRFRPREIAIKLKLSQNHPLANQQAVMTALAGSQTAAARETAHWMQRRLSEQADNTRTPPDEPATVPRPSLSPTSGTDQ